jgi:hypothetical protein
MFCCFGCGLDSCAGRGHRADSPGGAGGHSPRGWGPGAESSLRVDPASGGKVWRMLSRSRTSRYVSRRAGKASGQSQVGCEDGDSETFS